MFLTDTNITESIIIDYIREISSNSATGPGGIPPSLLLNCAHELAPSLLILFKQSLLSRVIDPSLKKAAIVPVSTLLNVFDDIMHLMSGGNSVDMVYLDFAKAFDS